MKGGAPGGIIGGMPGGDMAGVGVGGIAYVCEGAANTAPEAASRIVGTADASEAPMRALWASSCALSSSSERGRFSILGRLDCGWVMEPGLRPSSISLRRL